jgi:hypothetical protein
LLPINTKISLVAIDADPIHVDLPNSWSLRYGFIVWAFLVDRFGFRCGLRCFCTHCYPQQNYSSSAQHAGVDFIQHALNMHWSVSAGTVRCIVCNLFFAVFAVAIRGIVVAMIPSHELKIYGKKTSIFRPDSNRTGFLDYYQR